MLDVAATAETGRFEELATRALQGEAPTREEALDVLSTPDDDLLSLLAAAFRVRRRHFGRKVKLNVLMNAKSGVCPEDCGYCSQSVVSTAPIPKYSFLSEEVILEGARAAWERKAGTYCIVASGRGPSARELREVTAAVRADQGGAADEDLRLPRPSDRRASAPAEGSGRRPLQPQPQHERRPLRPHHDDAHVRGSRADDRARSSARASRRARAPSSACARRTSRSSTSPSRCASSMPTRSPSTSCTPIDGTPLEGYDELDPRRCLKVLCLFRLVCPSKEIRVSGGREVNLRSLQPLSLYPANAIFIGDYLTTSGQTAADDYRMIEDLGFEIEECAL